MTAPSPADQLQALDAAIAARPDHAELHFHRAALLSGLGRTDEARAAYLEVLARQPDHFGALNDLGTLLYRTDFRSAARLVYAEAVKHHPANPIARINLGNLLLADGAFAEARAEFEAALRLDPRHPDAHQGLANLLQHLGEAEAADWRRRQSYAARGLIHTPFQGEGEPCRVLVLASAVGGNIPTRFILDPGQFDTRQLAVEAFTPGMRLPVHDVVFNSIGDADLAPAALEAAVGVLAHTDARVINPPRRVSPTDRARMARRLSHLPGVVAPRIEPVTRTDLRARAEAFGFPLLLRSPGYHTGQNFEHVERAEDLSPIAEGLPGETLLLIEPLDARDQDGRWRKYRAMLIGGERFPLHLAVSDAWKVHYFSSAMADRPDLRAEEEAFLADMGAVIGPTAMRALEQIQATLGLDYAGVDFGLAPDGRLLLFEANAAMVVAPPGPEPLWDYRRAPIERILQATQALVHGRGRQVSRRR
jgi:Tetratricopeptide repeat